MKTIVGSISLANDSQIVSFYVENCIKMRGNARKNKFKHVLSACVLMIVTTAPCTEGRPN